MGDLRNHRNTMCPLRFESKNLSLLKRDTAVAAAAAAAVAVVSVTATAVVAVVVD